MYVRQQELTSVTLPKQSNRYRLIFVLGWDKPRLFFALFLCCIHFSLEHVSLNTSFSCHFLFTVSYQLAAHQHSALLPRCLKQPWRSPTHNQTFSELMTWKPPLRSRNGRLCHRHHRHQLKKNFVHGQHYPARPKNH